MLPFKLSNLYSDGLGKPIRIESGWRGDNLLMSMAFMPELALGVAFIGLSTLLLIRLLRMILPF